MDIPVRARLEVLPMPMPAQRLTAGDGEDVRGYLALAVAPRPEVFASPDDPAERAFYRWVLGHHLAFGTWRLLGDLLEDLLRDGVTDAGMAEAALWYDRYSALQLYAGSCTADTYAQVIRARMMARNPAFSGVWARDYERVLALLGRYDLPADGVLKQALKRHRLIHMTLAKILVPQGESLLKQAGRRPGEGATDDERDTLDEFFLVHRRPTSDAEFRAHLLRRVAALQCDLAARPLDLPTHTGVADLLPAGLSSMMRDLATTLAARPLLEEHDGPRQTDRTEPAADELRRRAS
ncbi:hypothetical protein FHX82_003190 [Amycolatopsis bartoniae]|uniref:L-tyrosine 3-hydroxylase n=1 Tax=Amycolatopsis bartoniae TaxID=941986 RepID=A0A8H9J5T3_9PSEU|nr:L-tyrosine 3-hydroxylase [Amycolatopsis bartoniae]MBB2936136.1 hypothetical protein [Amycolatopsis bartoniae]TVT07150.1 L-tyrosine 3-hydroxylase [Amycolatopsis bartoniae]GHF81304.1 hypothetical protein GCM10017566_64370 [Amycolatopsis bartoniae]